MNTTIGQVRITLMSQEEAESVAAWRYEPPYDFYDTPADEGDLAELLDPVRRAQSYFSVRDFAGELVGFFQFRREGDVVVVGLGLRPDFTGRGLGETFLEAGLAFARKRFAPRSFRLSVAAFNRRAIAVYERGGFSATRTFVHETNGSLFPFVEMERQA